MPSLWRASELAIPVHILSRRQAHHAAGVPSAGSGIDGAAKIKVRCLQHTTDSAGDEDSIWTECCLRHAVRERDVMKQHSALPIDEQRLSILINSEQHNAIRTHAEGRQLPITMHTCYYRIRSVQAYTTLRPAA